MHSAPAVSYPVRRWPALRLGLIALSLLGAVGLLAWQLATPAPWQLVLLAWLAWAACASCGLAADRRLAEGMLHWDGQLWRFEPTRRGAQLQESVWTPAQMAIALDLQSLVLASLRAQPHWLWLRAACDPVQWGDLRRALHQHSGHAGANP